MGYTSPEQVMGLRLSRSVCPDVPGLRFMTAVFPAKTEVFRWSMWEEDMVVVYGKPKCQKCDAAKKNLGLMGLDFKFVDVEVFFEYHDDWRTSGVIEVMSFYDFLEKNEKLPIFQVDGKLFNYPKGMRHLKEMSRSTKHPAVSGQKEVGDGLAEGKEAESRTPGGTEEGAAPCAEAAEGEG